MPEEDEVALVVEGDYTASLELRHLKKRTIVRTNSVGGDTLRGGGHHTCGSSAVKNRAIRAPSRVEKLLRMSSGW